MDVRNPRTTTPSDMQCAMLHELVLLLCAAAAICGCCAASSDVDTFGFPVFNATTTKNLIAVSNNSRVMSVSRLFEPFQVSSEVNRSEGFLLLWQTINIRRSGNGGGIPDREASFNTTFTLAGSSPVAFVVLKDSLPTLNTPGGFRGFGNASAPDDAAASAGSLGAVEVGAVRSYGRDDPAVGLNVTITPNGTAPSRTVWIKYSGATRNLSVYIAAGGQPKPAKAIIDTELDLAGRQTTEMAHVGFFSGAIRDVIDNVRGWELMVDVLPGKSDGNRKKETSWVMILLVVLLSVASTVGT